MLRPQKENSRVSFNDNLLNFGLCSYHYAVMLFIFEEKLQEKFKIKLLNRLYSFRLVFNCVIYIYTGCPTKHDSW